MKKGFALLAVMLLAVMGLARPQGRTTIKPNDLVSVLCDEENTISKDYTITRDGFIIMQFVGALKVSGMTEAAAGQKISNALVSERILKTATVHVKVLSAGGTSVTYAGAVKNTGSVPSTPGLHLSDVVTLAQPTSIADLERVKIITASGNQLLVNYKDYDGKNMANNPELRPGDEVFFGIANYPGQSAVNAQGGNSTPTQPQVTQTPQNPVTQTPANQTPAKPPVVVNPGSSNPPVVVNPNPGPAPTPASTQTLAVSGAVLTPKGVPFQQGMGVSQAVSEAGGLLSNSDVNNVEVHRKIDGNIHVLKLNLHDVQSGMAGDILLRPTDSVNVPYKNEHHGISKKTLKIGGLILLGLLILH